MSISLFNNSHDVINSAIYGNAVNPASNLFNIIINKPYNLVPEIVIPDDAIDISIGVDGIVSVTQPGQAQATQVGQMSLTNFINPAGLHAMGDNLFLETDSSGQPIEGTPGENGLLQSYFELLRIPYTTCDVLVSALTFNKLACKAFVKEFGVLTAKAIILRKGDEVNISKIINYLGLPCFVKPNNGGSSFGASKVKLTEELLPAIENALKEDNEVIIEEFIKATELTCGVFKTRKNQYVFPITEVVSKNEFFDYEAKYTPGKSEEITPARISTEMEQRCKALSSSIYDILKCNGIVRIDYLLRENDLYFMEINTVPGMSQQSIIPQQVRVLGLELHEIFNELIDDSIERMKIR